MKFALLPSVLYAIALSGFVDASVPPVPVTPKGPASFVLTNAGGTSVTLTTNADGVSAPLTVSAAGEYRLDITVDGVTKTFAIVVTASNSAPAPAPGPVADFGVAITGPDGAVAATV